VAPEAGLKILGIIDEKTGASRMILEYPAIKLEELALSKADAVIVCVETDEMHIEELARHVRDGSEVYRLI